MRTVFHAWSYGRFIEIQRKKERERNFIEQIKSDFLESSFSNRNNPNPIWQRKSTQAS